MLRLGVSEIPPWQILVSIGLLMLSIAAGLSLSIRVFRIYMLIHDKRPGLRTIMKYLKSS
jgi:ABC-2 type transport system permease protein